MLPSSALPWKSYRDPMLVLQDKQEEAAAAEKAERARQMARTSLARQRAEALFAMDRD